ncbi:MAG: hypothetical protein JWM32_1775 [Verrucomicrobia bacterium]|nr:hypothetical protein [Verrucomicrobiota bacterium]
MSLFLATLLPGLFLAVLGGLLASNQSIVTSSLKTLPRSPTAALFFFGAGAAWFVWVVWHSSTADNFDHPIILSAAFAAVALLSFKCVPDFLAVRGLCVLALLIAWHLRAAAYMEYEKPLRLLMVTPMFLVVGLALWLGVQPYRLRDFFEWLFARAARARGLGALLLGYGVVLVAVAFTY